MRYYIVDAFADALFQGNQAGVCLPEAWPGAALMQAIARENNLSETAFAVGRDGRYGLRWFTPAVEIELCGHATLATAYVILAFVEPDAERVVFDTLSGELTVTRRGALLEMDFPTRPMETAAVTATMREAVGTTILEAHGGHNLTLVLESAEAVRTLSPDMAAIRALREYHGVIVTAAGNGCDFVSRFFAPGVGVDEDPVTGSTHTSLVPLWAKRLGKQELVARQLSRRGGTLWCRYAGDRVFIAGKAALYLQGELMLAE